MSKHFQTLKHTVWLPYHFSLGPVVNRFYEGLKEEKIWANQCPQCNKVLVPARTFCPECNRDMGEWVEASQEGEIRSWTLARKPFFGAPAETPLVAALIRLDGTDNDFLYLVGGVDPDDPESVTGRIKRGARVRAVWREEKSGHMTDLQYFEPA